jgi:hypothetical protein
MKVRVAEEELETLIAVQADDEVDEDPAVPGDERGRIRSNARGSTKSGCGGHSPWSCAFLAMTSSR